MEIGAYIFMERNDIYSDFDRLSANEQEGTDYRIILLNHNSDIVIVAPHGGGIEPGTSEIAKAIAGQEFSLYCFEGAKKSCNLKLHITSTNFDEPECIKLIAQSKVVIGIHGLNSECNKVYVGGCNKKLKESIIKKLEHAPFNAKDDKSNHSGTDKGNICNKGISGEGLQLEISNGLRKKMFKGLSRNKRKYTTKVFNEFVDAISSALPEYTQ